MSHLQHFFIVGAPKAATTWLASVLAAHPQVHMSRVKEPHFFAPPVSEKSGREMIGLATDDNVWRELSKRGTLHSGWIRDPDNYRRLMEAPPGVAAAGEATVAYLHAPDAPARIFEWYPDACIIVVIREPVSRALSHLHMDITLGRVSSTPEEVLARELECVAEKRWEDVRYLSRSLYAEPIDRYLRKFGRDRLLVLRFDDVKIAEPRVLESVARNLAISITGLTKSDAINRNTGRQPRWERVNRFIVNSGIKDAVRRILPVPALEIGKRYFYRSPDPVPLSESLHQQLIRWFEPDILATQAITGLDLSPWIRRAEDSN